jgi:hypothetical protein
VKQRDTTEAKDSRDEETKFMRCTAVYNESDQRRHADVLEELKVATQSKRN